MNVGDLAFFYHSNCKPPGIVGMITVVKTAYDDFTALDPENKHFDKKSTAENNRWSMVDVDIVRKFDEILTLKELKKRAQAGDNVVANMALLNRMRLSVTKVTKTEWDHIMSIVETETQL